MIQPDPLPGQARNGGLVADHNDVAFGLFQTFQHRCAHPLPDGFRCFRAFRPDVRIPLPGFIAFRPADHNLGKGQPIPFAEVLLLKPFPDQRLRAERPGGFKCTGKVTAKHGLPGKFRNVWQQRSLHPPDGRQRQIRVAKAPALSKRDIGVPVTHEINRSLSLHSNIPSNAASYRLSAASFTAEA